MTADPSPSLTDAEVLAKLMYQGVPNYKSTTDWDAVQPHTRKRWINAAQIALAARQHDPRSTTEGLGLHRPVYVERQDNDITFSPGGEICQECQEPWPCTFATLATKAAQWDAVQGVVEAVKAVEWDVVSNCVDALAEARNEPERYRVEFAAASKAIDALVAALAALDTPTEPHER